MFAYVRQSNRYATRSGTYYDKRTKALGSKSVDFSSLPVALVCVEKSALFLTGIDLRNLIKKRNG